MKTAILVGLVLAISSSCFGQEDSLKATYRKKFESVTLNMNREEVEQILGKPDFTYSYQQHLDAGIVVYRETLGDKVSGNHVFLVNKSEMNLSSNLYFIVVETGNGSITKKLVVQ